MRRKKCDGMGGVVMNSAFRLLLVAILAVCAALLAPALGQAAGEYDLEFSVVSNGGDESSSISYDVVDSVKLSGVEEAPQSSAAYEVESLLVVPEAPTSVNLWYLF